MKRKIRVRPSGGIDVAAKESVGGWKASSSEAVSESSNSKKGPSSSSESRTRMRLLGDEGELGEDEGEPSVSSSGGGGGTRGEEEPPSSDMVAVRRRRRRVVRGARVCEALSFGAVAGWTLKGEASIFLTEQK
jgi:hypothetical protein